jgi:hypothetical protein
MTTQRSQLQRASSLLHCAALQSPVLPKSSRKANCLVLCFASSLHHAAVLEWIACVVGELGDQQLMVNGGMTSGELTLQVDTYCTVVACGSAALALQIYHMMSVSMHAGKCCVLSS